MKEYPATSKHFKVNGKVHTMRKFTLGLQADIEDDNTSVTYVDILNGCTDMTEEEIMSLDQGQIESIGNDIQEFTYKKSDDGGEPKKQ